MTVGVTYERCVRTRSVSASCQACVDACPTGAVTLGGPRHSVEVALEDCVECGLCQGACPMDAFHGVFDPVAMAEARPRELACGQGGLPCVGALSPEELITLAAPHGGLEVIARPCAAGDKGHERARMAVERARVFARAAGLALDLSFREEPPEAGATKRPDQKARRRGPMAARRRLLGMLVPRAEARVVSSPARLDVAAIRAVSLTARRQRLLSALPGSTRPVAESLPADSVACSSGKRIARHRCTACMMCINACPTGALTTQRLQQEIRFEARRCVNCGLCHDSCEPGAITVAPEVSVAGFLSSSTEVLVRFHSVQCGECGALFEPEPDATEAVCKPCRDKAAEARKLWGAP